MASFNKVILIGHLTADPELKKTQNGLSVTTFSIGVNRKGAKDGAQAADFITIVAWRGTAEFITQYFKKGNPILICGQIQTRSWTDNQGNKRYATEVVADEAAFVSSPSEQAKGNEPLKNPYERNEYQQAQYEEIPNEEGLPF